MLFSEGAGCSEITLREQQSDATRHVASPIGVGALCFFDMSKRHLAITSPNRDRRLV